MTTRVVIVERDPADPTLWHYGLEGSPRADLARLRHDPQTHCGEPMYPGPVWDDPLYVTAALLVRQDCTVERIVYDMSPERFDEPPLPAPPRRSPTTRSTAGYSKGRGETLGERAERLRRTEDVNGRS
jgi:hypothetical protein